MIDKKLLALLGDNKKYIFYAVGLMIVGLFANLAITASICYAIQYAAEYASSGSDAQGFILPAIVVVIAMVIRYVTSRRIGDLKDTLGRNVKKDLRQKIYDKIIKLGVRTTDNMSMAGLTQLSMEGVEQLDLYYSAYIPQFFYAMIAPIILFIVTVRINWAVALVLLACVPLIPMSIIAVSRYAKKIFAKYWGKYTSMGDSFLDSVQGLKELKIFQADAAQNIKMNETSEEFRKITMKVLVMQLASTTIMDMVAYGGAGLGIALTIHAVVNGSLSAYAALFLILVAVDFFLPLRAFGSAFHIAMNGASAGNKILSLLAQPDPVWGSETVDSTGITVQDVTFSYDGTRDILKHASMNFGSTGMYAIVGESGSGKSTVVNLLLGAYHPQQGSILVGNKLLGTLSRDAYYSHISVVSYNTYIFNETIRQNFALAKANVTDEEIYNALKKVNLYDFIIDNGDLDKVITEDAANISGGQKQRLSIARALVKDAQVYIFDDTFSALDYATDAKLRTALAGLIAKKHATVFIVAQRISSIMHADKIIVLDQGKMAGIGTHEELLKNCEVYQEIAHSQLSREELGE